MLFQASIQAPVWHALNNYAYQDAIFIAERLYAEVNCEDTLFLLATCYYRAGKVSAAYSVLKTRGHRSPQCRFLFAKCCMDLKKLSEAEFAIVGNTIAKSKSLDEVANEFGDFASFAIQLFAQICYKTARISRSAEAYRKSLKLNPFLWSSYESLVNLGEKPEPSKIFNINNIEQGNNYFNNLMNKSLVPNPLNSTTKDSPVCTDTSQDSSQLSGKNSIIPPSPAQTVCSVPSPLTMIRSTPDVNLDVFTPENNSWIPFSSLAKNNKKISRNNRNLFATQNSLSPFTPCFGVLPLSTPSANQEYDNQSTGNVKKPMSKRSQDLNQPKFQIFGQSGNNNNTSSSLSQTPQASLPPVSLSSVRRSSRLFSSSNSVKENNKSSSRTSRFISSKAPSKKPKARMSRTSANESKESEMNEINKSSDIHTDSKNNSSSLCVVAQAFANFQKASAEGLMLHLQTLGKAQMFMSSYACKKAIEVLNELPPNHFETGWVLSTLGRAYFELADYSQAISYFEEARRVEPYRVQGMEYYSTALWHQQKEVALSALTQQLTELDKEAPQTWCAAGNCFSLQKEHETAIKFLQRALQVDPDFPYAYTLLGHEHVMTEEMEKAMACFRHATRIDQRHYNAWYGIGMIYYKQEKFRLAEMHYKKAYSINPQSSVLMCHIGVVQHNLKRMDSSLSILNKAIAMDPKNPLCKFHRASVYFSLDRHEEALKDLDELKEIVPKESLVYFLIGKVHKKLGNTHLTMMNFSWATDLDPRGANNQIKGAIDKQYTNEEEDTTPAVEQGIDDTVSVSSGLVDHDSSHDSSVVDPEVESEDARLRAMETDERF